MSKFIFGTLSVGLEYTRDYTTQLINEVLALTTSRICITTDHMEYLQNLYGDNPRVLLHHFDRANYKMRLPVSGHPNSATDFNFNLKYVAVESIITSDIHEEYVIFMDCDDTLKSWDEEKTYEILRNSHDNGGYEFWGYRVAEGAIRGLLDGYMSTINTSAQPMCIAWHKIWAYDLIHTHRPEWDNAPFPVEHFFIMKNINNNIRKFADQWKWFHDRLASLPYTHGTWAEGVEIGISAHVAGYKCGTVHDDIASQFIASGHKEGYHHATTY